MGRVIEDTTPFLADLSRLAALRDEVDDLMLKAVKRARKRGLSWYKIGPAMGVTRQAAAEKYAKQMVK